MRSDPDNRDCRVPFDRLRVLAMTELLPLYLFFSVLSVFLWWNPPPLQKTRLPYLLRQVVQSLSRQVAQSSSRKVSLALRPPPCPHGSSCIISPMNSLGSSFCWVAKVINKSLSGCSSPIAITRSYHLAAISFSPMRLYCSARR